MYCCDYGEGVVDIELWRKKHHLLTEILLVLYHSLLAPPSHSPRHRSPPIFTTQAGLYSMPTLSSHAPAHTTPSSKRDAADFEPDDEWKRKLKQDIEQSFKSMIQSARDNQQVQLIEGNLSQEELDHEYKRTLHNIKGLAEEQYQLALMKERNERRWIAGVQMLPGWNDSDALSPISLRRESAYFIESSSDSGTCTNFGSP